MDLERLPEAEAKCTGKRAVRLVAGPLVLVGVFAALVYPGRDQFALILELGRVGKLEGGAMSSMR